MGILSNLFQGKNTEVPKEEKKQESFVLGEKFLQLAQIANTVDDDLGTKIQNMSGDLQEIKQIKQEILQKIEEMNQAYTRKQKIEEYRALCTTQCEIALDTACTYEDFCENKSFQRISILSDILKIAYECQKEGIEEFYKDFQLLSAAYDKEYIRIEKFAHFSQSLHEEITQYANVVNQAKTKFRLSPDWNGKKGPLIALGKQLEEKRERFISEEKEISSSILEMGVALQQAYQTFCDLEPIIVEIFAQAIVRFKEYSFELENKKNILEKIYNDLGI